MTTGGNPSLDSLLLIFFIVWKSFMQALNSNRLYPPPPLRSSTLSLGDRVTDNASH